VLSEQQRARSSRRTDAELASLRAANQQESLAAAFRQHLAQSPYPKAAVPKTSVGFHSHEEIVRAGGYYYYYK